jgi:hypothetical protein
MVETTYLADNYYYYQPSFLSWLFGPSTRPVPGPY